MSSGPVVALALCKPGAIRSWRLLCGPTNSAVAARDKPASLRARFGIDGTRNATHGSDSPAAAARELRFYFPTLPLATEGSQVTGAGAVEYIKSTVVAEVYDVAKGHTVTKTVDAVLVDALAELAKAKPSSAPEEAIAWLGQWLLDNNPRRGVVGAGTTKEPTVEEPEEGGSSGATKAHALPPRRPRALARGAPKEGSEGAGTPTPPPPTPPTKRTIVFVLGAPGSGKGTQCALIAARFGFTHLSTGDLLRAEVDSGSAMGAELSAIMARGELVSTALVLQLVGAAMEASGSSKFLLDGYPRALDQAVQFEATLGAPAFVLSFDCPEAVLERRLLARGVASGRADDANIDVIRARFATYTTHSAPVEAFYGRLGMLRRVNSARALEAVTADTVAHFRPQTAWLLGGPGAGRSTMAERVAGMGLGWNHLSTGELLRAEAASGSELGHELATAMARGDGAPLGTVVSLVAAAIERIDPVGRFVLDGGVRDMDMAVAFEAAFGTPSFIVSLTAPDAVLLARASGRAHAATAAASTSKAKGGASASASASGATSPRSDEHSAVHRKQLESFKTLTAPVLDMYATKALVRPVDAGRGEAEVWEDVRAIFSPTCVFMLGGPGSGKGTQCSLAAAEFGYTHLCTSSLLRGEVERGSAVGGVISSHLTSGTLVPTEITLGLIKASIIASRASHILLDGFPRALDQAQAFCASICPPAFVVHLECPEGVAAARLSAAAAAAGGSSEEDSSSSSTSAAALKRARAYTATTLPVLDLFATQGKVRTVDAGEGTPAAVYASLREVFRPTVVYVLGYPGSGKRTQCARTAATYGYTHLCVGDMVRGEVASGSEVGKGLEAALGAGELVPDEVVLGMLHKAMAASGSRRFILNGFPRTARQAQLLEKGDAPGAAGGGEAEAEAEGSGSGSGSAGNGRHRGLGLPAFAVHLEGTKGVVSARLRAPSALARGRVDDTEELIAVRCAGYDKDTLPVVHALDGARLLRTLSALPPPDAVFSRLRRLFTPQVVVLLRDEGCGGAEFCTRVGRELGYATLDVPALLAREAASGSVDGKAIGAALAARRTPPLGPTLGVLERAMAACVSATPRFILDGFPRVISAGFPGVHDQVMAAEERLGAFKGAVVLSAGLDTRIARAGAKAPGEVAVVRAQGDTYRREKLPVAHFFEKLGKVCAIDTSTPLAINPDDLLEAARPYLE